MPKSFSRWVRKYERYIQGTGLVFVAISLLFFAHYIYTGKGWRVVQGKESIADFYFNRGNYYFNGGSYNLDVARQSFTRALAYAGGTYPYAHYQLGRIAFISGDFSLALHEENAELTAYPDHVKVHYMKGLIYGYRKQYINAEEEFRTYVSAMPREWAGYNDLAWIYFAEGDYENASRTARKGLAVAPENAWLMNSYAIAQLNLGHYAEAEVYLKKAEAIFRDMDDAEWGRAYPGNNPVHYQTGLEQIRAVIGQNLNLVHTKLNHQ